MKHYSVRTEQAYVDWIRRFILFHHKRHPNEMGEREITEFLTHLAVEKNVSASTQNQAFAALLFLYQQVLERKLAFIDNVQRVTRPAKLPVVLTPAEARAVLAHLKAEYRLMAELLYGSGLRLMECLRLRVKDVDFGYHRITVRDAKGLRERVALLPQRLQRPLRAQIVRVKELHRQDLVRAAAAESICRSRWNGNIPARLANLSGNIFFPLQNFRLMHALAKFAAIMSRKKTCKTPSKSLCVPRAFANRRAVIRSGTVLPRTCSKMGTISVPSRNCSATRTSRLQWYILTS